MFGHQSRKRSTGLPFVIFRTLVSLMVFALMLGGLYSAYKSFSGMDPLKLDPKAVLNQLIVFLPVSVSSKIPSSVISTSVSIMPSQPQPNSNRKLSFSFLLISDAHSEENLLQKALNQAKQNYPDLKFIIGLGDYTEVGTIDQLKKAKAEFDPIGVRYFLIPGDHDYWDARDKKRGSSENFTQVFGPTYQTFTYGSIKFILLDNADNYLGLGDNQLEWLYTEMEKIKEYPEVETILAFIHKPLFHPSSEHIMGSENPELKLEARNLAKLLKENGVKEVFAGDIHYFTRYQDSSGLAMTTIGAIASQRNTQNSRYAVVEVYEDSSYDVKDLEIKL